MGAGWRRVSEKAKQNYGFTVEKNFAPTPNARNEAMLKEAGDFAGHLKRCEKDIRGLKVATEGLLNTTKIVMSAPLPRVYEDAGNGKAQAVTNGAGPSGSTIGGDFKVDDLARVAKETAKKLEAEVLAPMQRWTTAYNTVLTRMKRLEGMRLEVDSRRRTVGELGKKIERQRANLPKTRAKGEFEMEQTIKKLQHKENKLAAARQSYKEQEALVYQQLAQLIRDAVWLKSYIAAVMRLEQEAFQSAYTSLGPAKAALQLPMQHHEVPAIPVTPEHASIAGRADNTPPQGHVWDPQAQAQPRLATMGSLTNKVPAHRRAMSAVAGKENGLSAPLGAPVAKENGSYAPDAPPAPTHRITRPVGAPPAGGYDRYAENNYGQPVPAW